MRLQIAQYSYYTSIYMTELVLVSCFGLECLTLKIADIISYFEAQTIPDCIRYIIGIFCCNL